MTRRGASVLALAGAVLVASQNALPPAPTNINIASGGRYIWTTGVMDVNWTRVGYAVEGYRVTASPLDYTNTFDNAQFIQDFVVSPAAVGQDAFVNNATGTLDIVYSGNSWQSPAQPSRGLSPYIFRRIPDGAVLELNTINCTQRPAGASSAMCGFVIYNAGTNTPLITWMVGFSSAFNSVVVSYEAYAATTVFRTADRSASWPLNGTQLRIERNTADATRPWTLLARTNTSIAWANVTTRVVVLQSQLDSFDPGDLWYGMGSKAANGTSTATAVASFDDFRMMMPIPTTLPRDILNNVDVCVKTTSIEAVSAWANATDSVATVSGLSSNFPYMMTVWAVVSNATGNFSAASMPIEGTYFWARRAPPRQQRLAAWWSAKYLPAGSLSFWPDYSGNGHHLRQTSPTTTLRPTTLRHTTAYGGSFIAPGYVRFARSSGQFMTSGSDSIDFGVTGPMTIYFQGRIRQSTLQVLAGRGMAATNWDATPGGWVLGVWSTVFDNVFGYLGMRIADLNGTQAGGSVRNVLKPVTDYYQTTTTYTASVAGFGQQLMNSQATMFMPRYLPPVAMPVHNISTCVDVACTNFQFGFWDTALNNTFRNPITVTWNGTNAAPAVSAALAFRVGGVATPTGNPMYSFEGDIYEMMIYRESHTRQQRQAISDWFTGMIEINQCPRDIWTPLTTMPTTSNCRQGPLLSNECWQDCSAGAQFLGLTRTHICVGGTWNAPPLHCARMCPDVASPIYTATCTRRWFADDWNATRETWTMAKFWTWPTIPEFQRSRVWSWDTARQLIVASTLEVDPCDRLTGAASHLGYHNTRWNSFVPPGNNLGMTARSDIMLLDANSTVGLSNRLLDHNNHYRAEISANRLAIVRVWGGVATVIAQSTNITFPLNRWLSFSFTAKVRDFSVQLNNVTLLTTRDNGGYQTWGAVGMYLGSRSTALFDNFIFDSDCDTGLNARWMFDKVQVLFQCLDGYTTIGNTTWTCNAPGGVASGYNGASLICLSKPPTPVPVNLTIAELSKNGTYVGQVMAMPSNLQQTISYTLVQQWPRAVNGTPAFTISGCSGAIRVNDPTQIDYWVNPFFTLTIFAWPDTQTIAGVAFNVSVEVEQVPTPPSLGDVDIHINATQFGPLNVPWNLYNRNRYPLVWSIVAGDSFPPTFAIDRKRGNMSVLAPGITWTQNNIRTLSIKVAADGIESDTPLETTAFVTITIDDINMAPTWYGAPIFTLKENFAVEGSFVGSLVASDPNLANQNAPSGWTNLTYSLARPVAWGPNPSIFSVLSDGSVYMTANLTFDPVTDYEWFNGKKARRVFPVPVTACDLGDAVWPALCTNITARIGVMAINDTMLLSFVESMPSPPGPMSTQGGEIIRLLGSDFPQGGRLVVTYESADKLRRYTAAGCFIRSDNLAECRSVPGYGQDLRVSIIMDGSLVNSSSVLTLSYAAPTVDSVTITNTAGLTTAGSADGAVLITGQNFGPPGTPVTIRFGATYEWTMAVAGGNNYTQYVTHTTIVATLGEACGARLPVMVTIGGQSSTCTGGGSYPCSVSYPGPTLSAVVSASASYNVSSLSTLGGQRVFIYGANLGPARNAPSVLGGVPLTIVVSYSDASNAFRYSMTCLKVAGTPHTALDCETVPGVGRAIRFSADVCYQVSPSVPLSAASYAGPVLKDVVGPGTSRASTEGGQRVIIQLQEAGPTNSINSSPQAITAVRYGTPGILQYAAESCYVSFASTKGSEITCLTAPGTGAGHYWYVEIGFQAADILPKNSSYGAPILSFFTGLGATNADTRAGSAYPVIINGFNMGADLSLVQVSYSTRLIARRASDGLQPSTDGQPEGTVQWIPTQCQFVTPHRALSCIMPPGAAAGLTWTLVVDSQVSTAPTTSFAAPVVTDVFLADGSSTVTSDGGSVVSIRGLNFGLSELVQAVRFGPTGTEFPVSSWNYTDHTALEVVLGPGIGSSLAFTVLVADQTSNAFRSNLSYGVPIIDACVPAQVPAEQDPGRPTLITCTGREFALLNPDVQVEVAWGNPSDSTVQRLPVLSRTPTLAQVTSTDFHAGPSPVNFTVTFAAPSGLGQRRAIRIIQYLRGQQFTDAQLSTLPLQGMAGAVDYVRPSIDFAFVYRLSRAENDTLAMLFPSASPSDVYNARRIEIRGTNIGPPADMYGDSIVRRIQVQPFGSPVGYWSNNLAGFLPINWTSNRLDAFVLSYKAAIRVLIASQSFDGSMTYNQTSDPYDYSDVSPQISALTGQPQDGFPTTGGAGNIITISASGLTGAFQLNVTVGVAPLISQCPLLTVDGGRIINNDNEAIDMLQGQSGNVLLNDFLYTIRCQVPAGQGKNVPVLVWRNGQPSGTTNNAVGNTITYRTPSMTFSGVFDPSTNNFARRAFPATAFVDPPTDGNLRVRIEGTDFGVCPSLSLYTDPTSSQLTYIEACTDAFDANGKKIKVPNPDVRWSHTFIDFYIPAGEGTGLQTGTLGWYLTIGAGEGNYRQEDTRPLLIRYRAPQIFNIATAQPVDTRGNAVLTVQGANFGFRSLPVVHIGSQTRSWLPCTNVYRASHYTMSCVVPPGSGRNLLVRVQVADLTGYGGSFNYTAPVVDSMTLIPAASLTPYLMTQLRMGAYMNGTVANSTSIVAPMLAGTQTSGPQLVASPHGGDVIVIDGASFSYNDPAYNCLFFGWAPAWASLATPDFMTNALGLTTGVPKCDGKENFLGEGEVYANSSIVYWNHTRIIAMVPAGVGARVVAMMPGGQLPDAPARYHNLRYDTPAISRMAAPGELSTNGGNILNIMGYKFAPPVVNSFPNVTSRAVTYPVNLPFGEGLMHPHQQMRVDFGSPFAAMPCVASAWGAQGEKAAGASNCLMPAIQSIALSRDGSSEDVITMITPPGVGKNKPVYVTYLNIDGTVLSRSNLANFTYDPPRITSLYPDLVLDNGATNVALYLRGANFGRLQDVPNFPPDEQGVEVLVGNLTCEDAQRVVKNQEDQVQCRLPPSMPVGFVNFTVNIAGQSGELGNDSPYTLLIGCQPEYFGHFGETCTPCPLGAKCRGFVQDESIGVRMDTTLVSTRRFSMYSNVNVTGSERVMVGDVEVARRGYHTYPVPIAGFFNLNGTMADACPERVRGANPGRDVCIVGCVPVDACLGANFCSEPYQSKAPYYRCAECNKGYYRSAGDCIKCPDSPYALVIGIALLIIGVATAGYVLNKYEFDIRIVTIGLDYFQVLAIFSQTKVSWPPEVKQLYRLLSAFNLNIEIVAPECFVPNMSYVQKFSAILAMPYAVLGLFLLVNICRFIVYRYCYNQKNWRQHLRNMASSISIALMLMFLFYLFSSRTILGVWECAPAKPDDGKRYLQVGAFEECGKPGGVQLTLIPYAFLGVFVLIAGFPGSVFVALRLNRVTIMQDQVLRALRKEPPKNTDIALLRSALSRMYFQFKPQYAYYWILVIVMRKFFIAFSSLVFSQNSSYQLAFCVLILVLAFAAQMRCLPYMPASEFDGVLRNVAERAKTDALWNQIKTQIVGLEALSRKKGHSNTMSRSIADAYSVGSKIGKLLCNYNTIEALLLLDAACVCLLGVLYTTVRPEDDYYETSRKSITINLMLLLTGGIIYFASVFVADLSWQLSEKRVAKADAASQAAKQLKKKRASLNGGISGMDILKDAPNMAESSTTTNPLFLRDGQMKTDSLAQMVRAQVEPPSQDVWTLIRDHYGSLTSQVGEITSQLNMQRTEVQRLTEIIKDAGLQSLLVDGDGAKIEAKAPTRARPATRRAFGPTMGGDADGGGDDKPEGRGTPPQTRPRRTSSVGESQRSPGAKAVGLAQFKRSVNRGALPGEKKAATVVVTDVDDEEDGRPPATAKPSVTAAE